MYIVYDVYSIWCIFNRGICIGILLCILLVFVPYDIVYALINNIVYTYLRCCIYTITQLCCCTIGMYRHVGDCVREIVRQNGFRSFYKGLSMSVVGELRIRTQLYHAVLIHKHICHYFAIHECIPYAVHSIVINSHHTFIHTYICIQAWSPTPGLT